MDESKVKYEIVPVDQLELDMKNPRIAKWVEMYGDNVNDEAIKLAIGAGTGYGEGEAISGPSYSALREAIRTNGGIIHPIIVSREPNGRLLVIEGNTRVVIYREFKWDTIPAMVYENMSEAEIDAIRLQAHLVGTREWVPYAKAKYLHYLQNAGHFPFSQLIDFCGGKRREVEDLIQAYKDMEEYYRPILESEQEFDHTRFSAFVELQAGRVRQALHTSGFSKMDFSKWVHERKFQPLNTVRQLPRILQNEKTKEVFLKDSAGEAIKILDMLEIPTTINLKDATLEMLVTEIYNRINAIPWSEIQRLRSEPDTDKRDLYHDARDALISFCKDIVEEND